MAAEKLMLIFVLAIGLVPFMVSSYDHFRLPTSLKPEYYDLRVITHLENPANLSFYGDVTIKIKVLENTQNITLHADNLTIDSRHITLTNPVTYEVRNTIEKVEVIAEHDFFIIHLNEQLYKGEEYYLFIPFSAPLNQKLRGYYRSSYYDKASNRTRWLAITQFEPASARSAFPCFDEPNYKAKFSIILGHHKDYTALSNMPLKQTEPMANKNDWVWSQFVISVPMSTYLVAYTINDFHYAKSETNLRNKVQFRTWARSSALDQCHYAAEIGPLILQYYEDLFDIKFPLEKIDQIAVPDFSSGAMENWGMVTYRESSLLYAKNVSSSASKQRVASVIAHELAHQWFGNLVTMKWWTDLWLNEGFATYIASLGIDYIHPEWRSLEEESVDNTLIIFHLDALKSSHPVSQPIKHVNQISEIFDSISYKKGSSVLRMLHHFLGNDAFQMGLYKYLTKHAYDNAEQDNLWASLTEAAHKIRSIPDDYDIKRIMDSWTLQSGYPIITVERDYEQKAAIISQERYLLDTSASRTEAHNCWWVPLSYTSQSNPEFNDTVSKEWLTCDQVSGSMISKRIENMPEQHEWVLFNIQMTGLYKVKYDQRNWEMLIQALSTKDFGSIHVVNRAQLIDDALSLAWSGDQEYRLALQLVEYLAAETEYIPWKAALDNLNNVHRILRQTPQYDLFKKYMQKILMPIYLHLGGLKPNIDLSTNHSTILHKSLVAGWSCKFEVSDCVPIAQGIFRNWKSVPDPDTTNPISLDLRSVIYCTGIRHGDDNDWEFLWARYKNSNVASEKRLILSALGCSREVWILQRYLQWAFNETSHIRKQDSYYAFGSVARGDVGFHLAHDFFISHIEFLHDYYEPDTTELSRLFNPLTSQMSTRKELSFFKNFSVKNQKLLHKSELSIKRALETILINTQWRERNYNDVGRYFQELI